MKALYILRIKEQWASLLAMGMGFVLFAAIMAWSYEAFAQDTGFMTLLFDQFKTIMEAMVGVGFSLDALMASYLAITWRHPLILFLILAFSISRSIGLNREWETGTGDLLFFLPYSRIQILSIEFLVTATGIVILNLFLFLSVYGWAHCFQLEDIPPFFHFFWVFLLSVFLYLMFSAMGYAIACWMKHSKEASIVAISILAALYFGDFLASLQPMFSGLKPLTLFHQYQVNKVLGQGYFPYAELILYAFLTIAFYCVSIWGIVKRDL